MPPLRTYVFKSISSGRIEISIETYGTAIDAEKRLSYHVKEPNNFTLKE